MTQQDLKQIDELIQKRLKSSLKDFKKDLDKELNEDFNQVFKRFDRIEKWIQQVLKIIKSLQVSNRLLESKVENQGMRIKNIEEQIQSLERDAKN